MEVQSKRVQYTEKYTSKQFIESDANVYNKHF